MLIASHQASKGSKASHIDSGGGGGGGGDAIRETD
jgi:hypothetical protein